MKNQIVLLGLGAFLFSFSLYADEIPAGLVTPPFFKEALRAQVDNSKGATLTVTDPKSRVSGASITIPAGALTNALEEVVLSYSDKLPGLPAKPGDGMSFVQNSQVFALQTSSGKVLKNISFILPYYAEQEITSAGTRVVMFNYWDSDTSKFETLEAKPIAGRVSFAKVQTMKIYPSAEILSLRLTQSPGFEAAKKRPPTPKGFKSVPNSDSCLKIDGPKLVLQPTGAEPIYEASFSNSCEYPIQASGCINKNGTKGCPLPAAIEMPTHSSNLLKLSGFTIKDITNLGACRMALADGTPVKYDLVMSSNSPSYTVCLVKTEESK